MVSVILNFTAGPCRACLDSFQVFECPQPFSVCPLPVQN